MSNEALLVSRVALLGDRKAFCQLVEAYQSPIRRFFRLSRKFCGNDNILRYYFFSNDRMRI